MHGRKCLSFLLCGNARSQSTWTSLASLRGYGRPDIHLGRASSFDDAFLLTELGFQLVVFGERGKPVR